LAFRREREKLLLDIKQAIHGALLKELLKTDENGKRINLIPLIHHAKLTVKCSVDLKYEKGCVDVIVSYPRGIYSIGESRILVTKEPKVKYVALELVTDISLWSNGPGKILEKVNRYKREYGDTRVIIPEEYRKQYAELFYTNDIRVHIWKGTRCWKCKKCGKITYDEHSSMKPYSCESGSCNSQQLYFVDLRDVEFK